MKTTWSKGPLLHCRPLPGIDQMIGSFTVVLRDSAAELDCFPATMGVDRMETRACPCIPMDVGCDG